MSLIDVDVMIAGLDSLAQHWGERPVRERASVYRMSAELKRIQGAAAGAKTWVDGAMAYVQRYERSPSDSALSSAASELAHAAGILKTLEVELRVRMDCAELLLYALGLELPEPAQKAA
jgi:hypothetical protein